jgi:hypothetical protein
LSIAAAVLVAACTPEPGGVLPLDLTFAELTVADGVVVGPDGTVAVLLQGRGDSGLVQLRDGEVVAEAPLESIALGVLPRPDGGYVLVLQPDGDWALDIAVAPAAGEGTEVQARETEPRLAVENDREVAMALSPDGETLYLAYTAGSVDGPSQAGVAAADPDTGRVLGMRALGNSRYPVGVAVSDDGATVSVVAEGPALTTEVWHLDAGLAGAAAPVVVDGYPVAPPAAGADGHLYLLADPGAADGPVLQRLAADADRADRVAGLPDGPYEDHFALAVDDTGARAVVVGRSGETRRPTAVVVDLGDGSVGAPVELAGPGAALAVASSGDDLLVAGTTGEEESRAALWSLP